MTIAGVAYLGASHLGGHVEADLGGGTIVDQLVHVCDRRSGCPQERPAQGY